MPGNLGRAPIQIVEIDMPTCSRAYGTLPCTAVLGTTGKRKCYNTRATCQSPTGYSGTGTVTMRFGQNQSGLPVGVIPALTSVSTRATKINLSGIDPKTTALGQRARVTVVIQDFMHSDIGFDPYVSQRKSGAAQSDGIGYNPADRGTALARWHNRWPYYLGKPLRVLEGYEGDALASMRTRHYVITEWSGPSAGGVVEITAKDVLDLADNDKAQAPRASRGRLSADITASDTSLTLIPATVGDEYGASGYLVIGREVMTFTRSGDVLTLTGRGLLGTVASSHKTNDQVQEALYYQAQRIDVIVADLLQTYAGVPASFIDAAAWQAEVERWLGGIVFTGFIPKPEGVAKLIGELCQHGVMIWWDEISQKIRIACNRPLDIGESYVSLTDDANIIAGTADIEDMVDARASQVWFWHGVVDPTQGISSSNMRALHVAGDLEGEGPDRYNEARVKEITSRWFGTAGDYANASVIADRLLARFRDTPIQLTCVLDAKDLAGMAPTAVLQVMTRLITDDTGAMVAYPMQVQYREETDPGNRVKIEAQTFKVTGRFGYIMLDGSPDYDAATAAQKIEGAWIVDDTLLSFPDGTGPYELY